MNTDSRELSEAEEDWWAAAGRQGRVLTEPSPKA